MSWTVNCQRYRLKLYCKKKSGTTTLSSSGVSNVSTAVDISLLPTIRTGDPLQH